jgi:trans-AT polyketide synthase/acyltransferase/oxidoreductase domain-containing protein
MYKGIASQELVTRMGRAGLLGYLGTGGMRLGEIAAAIDGLRHELPKGAPCGMNLLAGPPDLEAATVELYLERDIRHVEASAYLGLTAPLLRYRLGGLRRRADGSVEAPRRLCAKVSRLEVARLFFSPPPAELVEALRAGGTITAEEAALAGSIPVASDVCVESDSGGHTDGGVMLALFPTLRRLADDLQRTHAFGEPVRVGAAGGLGTPEAIAAAFLLGADFVVTGSINQCTVEAGTSSAVKDILQEVEVGDTTLAPAGDLFELGAKIQVLKRGLLFAPRANRLYELYRSHESLDAIPAAETHRLESQYFGTSLAEVWAETRRYLAEHAPAELARAERQPKAKMAAVFRHYFVRSNRLALAGDITERVNFQIQCGPALGACNAWLRGSAMENWRQRHVDDLAVRLMTEAAGLLRRRLTALEANAPT